MRKLLSVLGLLLIIASTANAQKLFSKEWKQWSTGKDSASVAKRESDKKTDNAIYFKNSTNQTATDSRIEHAGILLEKSATFQYSAIGCAAVSTGLLIGYGSMSDKFELGDDNKTQLTSTSKMLLIGGGVMAFVAIILEINAIECKSKAGKCLRMQATENGAGLAFVF